jgi:hypothetical protein
MFESLSDYESYVTALVEASIFPDATYIWWAERIERRKISSITASNETNRAPIIQRRPKRSRSALQRCETLKLGAHIKS